MKTIKYIILAVVLFGLTAFNYGSNLGTGHNVIYYIPHQDDETLTFGSSIYSHIQAGHNVHVVLLTDGGATVVGDRLGLTRKELVDARNREFDRALSILGVKQENIHKFNFADGKLKQREARNIMEGFETLYPNASHKTYSYHDFHSDHKNAGLALKALADSGKVSDARYYVRRDSEPEDVFLMRSNYKEEHYPFLLAASRSYNIKNEKLGFYGIGWESVPRSFERMEERPWNYYHR